MNTSLKVDFEVELKRLRNFKCFDLGVNQISLGTISVTNKIVMNLS